MTYCVRGVVPCKWLGVKWHPWSPYKIHIFSLLQPHVSDALCTQCQSLLFPLSVYVYFISRAILIAISAQSGKRCFDGNRSHGRWLMMGTGAMQVHIIMQSNCKHMMMVAEMSLVGVHCTHCPWSAGLEMISHFNATQYQQWTEQLSTTKKKWK